MHSIPSPISVITFVSLNKWFLINNFIQSAWSSLWRSVAFLDRIVIVSLKSCCFWINYFSKSHILILSFVVLPVSYSDIIFRQMLSPYFLLIFTLLFPCLLWKNTEFLTFLSSQMLPFAAAVVIDLTPPLFTTITFSSCLIAWLSAIGRLFMSAIDVVVWVSWLGHQNWVKKEHCINYIALTSYTVYLEKSCEKFFEEESNQPQAFTVMYTWPWFCEPKTAWFPWSIRVNIVSFGAWEYKY